MKLLTVTVPCYNSQAYMEKCINSLLAGGERVEIIIINDGSTDDTGRIANDYADRFPDMVKVVHQENGGHGEGINQGLEYATGTYFKVVDSDDTLSDDFPAFLDALEACEARGGVDLMVTNYYYVHSDGEGDRSICYASVLPQNKICTWEQTKRFRVHQLLTIHSCTFRTEVMRKSGQALPKHIFYEDNLMVYKTLPHVRKICYRNMDLYRYWIGRPDQSVQKNVMMGRYHHQILVTERCFSTVHLDEVREPNLRRYLKHELFMMFGISILYARLNKTQECDQAVCTMWTHCREFDGPWSHYFAKRTPLRLMCIPGKAGQQVADVVYRVANRVVRFN